MSGYLAYCRAGFESELIQELQDTCAAKGVSGYGQGKPNDGYVIFHCVDGHSSASLLKALSVDELIFARQLWTWSTPQRDLDPNDRIAGIKDALADAPQCGDVRVEYPDTTEGRELSKFCRKFTVPLRQTLRQSGHLTSKAQGKKPVLCVFFIHSHEAIIGIGHPSHINHDALGIRRLKTPADAPSRSTLKLDEAFGEFLTPQEQEQRLQPSMHAVDLGACPGGWTYQLTRRGMWVQAVDNGAMATSLMETGLVSHYPADGFKYEPNKKPVHWLVCDMVESPKKVADLMAQWVERRWCNEAIFNLKLPMKKRYETVQVAQEVIAERLAETPYQLRIKHLYHDREEVTCHLRRVA